MLLHVPQVLSAQQVQSIRKVLHDAGESVWTDGRATAGAQAVQVKANQQLEPGSVIAMGLGEQVTQALQAHPMFVSAALPNRMVTPLFNRYTGGGTYGNHIDGAFQRDMREGGAGRIRSDVSTTVFLCDPDEYEGGELVIEDNYGSHEVKLQAGDAIVYPSTSLHRVEPVTRGARMAAVLWTQSLVRDDARRAMLFELDMNILTMRQQLGDTPQLVSLTGHYHNLLRMWAEL